MDKHEFMAACKRVIKKVKPESADIEPYSYAATFEELGLDSLDTMNFFLEFDSEFEQPLSEIDVKEFNTLDKVYEYYKDISKRAH